MKEEVVKPLTDWYHSHRRDLPWRHTSDPYRIWVSEIMLQQTRVETVKEYYRRFTGTLPDIASLAVADEERLLKLWEGLGYYSRVRNMQKAARMVMQDFGGVFPKTREKILTLPGIGSYTAGAISSIAFGERVPAVDGNVMRVWARLTADRRNILLPAVKKAAENDIGSLLRTLPEACPEEEKAGPYGRNGSLPSESGESRSFNENAAGDLNQALIELGALVCLPGEKAKCTECPVRSFCEAERSGLTGVVPLREKKTERRIEHRTVLLVRSGEKTAVRRRPESGLLAGLYEFPNVIGELTAEQAVAYVAENGYDALRVRPLPAAKHVFSHVEWRMSGYEIRIAGTSGMQGDSGAGQKESVWLFADREEISGKRPLPGAFSAYAKMIGVTPGSRKHSDENADERNK